MLSERCTAVSILSIFQFPVLYIELRLDHRSKSSVFPASISHLGEFARIFPHLPTASMGAGSSAIRERKVNGVFREFSIPFIVSVRPFVAATPRAEKKAGADPGREKPPPNFSKARAAAIAIIPNEKVTRPQPAETAVCSEHTDRYALFFRFYVGLETPPCPRGIALLGQRIICNLRRLRRNRDEWLHRRPFLAPRAKIIS